MRQNNVGTTSMDNSKHIHQWQAWCCKHMRHVVWHMGQQCSIKCNNHEVQHCDDGCSMMQHGEVQHDDEMQHDDRCRSHLGESVEAICLQLISSS